MNGATDAQEPNAKKQKLAASQADFSTSQKYNLKEQETVESTTEYGHFFLDQIRRTADKNGRKVSGYFETLPDKDSNPDYYKKTRMPISLTMIEKKLNNGDFATLTELESYCKRMVSNAKEFYPRGSQLFEDAERVRKALSNFMTKYNPAYARGGYTAVPTPLPADGTTNDADEDDKHAPQHASLTFQAAQEKIVEEMLRKKDDGGQEPYFEPFVNLPPRVLKDYYRIVKEPISLKKLQKAVKGVRGRNEATGTSEFKNWVAFEETASLLWKNAFFYNEEGSEIYELAQELEEFCKNELKQAKAAVQEPAQPKIKLKVQQPASEQPATSKKITIHVGGKSDSGESPAPPIALSSGSQVGDQTPVSNGVSRQGGLPAIPAAMDRFRSVSVASPSPSLANNIKREDAARPSPAGTPGHGGTPSAFPPPGAGQAANLSNATFQPIGVAQLQPQTNGIQQSPRPLWDQTRRAPGKGAADALISSLKIQTHPMVNVERRFEITLLPLEKEAHQSVTVHMPLNHLRIQMILVVPSSLEKEGRQWRLFVLVNRQIAHQAHPVPGQVLPLGARVFEAQLQAGVVNNIEVSVAAALPKGQKLPSGADFEVEQMTVLAHVAKN
ncbi:protein polybromo-1 [Colletotrichum spaethianum]|uniref:Protein polybromo-1 n=1 Tax=Colletotrichum spaethianum TaxID=700344 RepID=A0AA37LC35_9PEZI|nr:protein polybromo-1 [Colletotrichum spaethianum]GKT43240.1 protein polybromo-1 [Colletotrichum spaethianum]